MVKISTPDKNAEKRLFHNEWINIYPTHLSLNDIHFWKDNNRTIFTFERLRRIKGDKKLEDISLEEIVQFIAEQDVHKLEKLAGSIEKSGVQVPLIIRDDGKLLDGNRRYFACQWLKMKYEKREKKIPETLLSIPVHVIRKVDLDKDETLEKRILAEANFIPDLKVPWPLDAQARAVDEYYHQIREKKKIDHEAAIIEIVNIFGIEAQRANDLLQTLELTNAFIKAEKTKDEQFRRHEIVEEKFVYFWEFLNKAMRGRGEYKDQKELKEVKDMFFGLMAKGTDNPITNVKQVEPLVQSKRDSAVWNILLESGGTEVKLIVSIINEKKEVRKEENKIRLFLEWLKEVKNLAPKSKIYLLELSELAAKKSK